MEKKITVIAIFVAICLAFASCGSTTSETPSSSEKTAASVASESSVTSSAEVSATNDPSASQAVEDAPVSASEGDLGSYHVSIKGARKGSDYEGNPVIIITYEWTNNSDDTTSPMGSMLEQAFQDGVEMELGIMTNGVNDSTKQVRPGTTIDVDAVYNLKSDSTIEFEISALEDMFKSPTPKVTQNFEPSELD